MTSRAPRAENNCCVEAVLAGTVPYDSVDAATQNIIRRTWDTRITARRNTINLADEFRAQGIKRWVTTDSDGNVIYAS